MSFARVLILFLIALGCSNSAKHKNYQNVDKVNIGDDMLEVVKKMEGLPDKWIIPDTTSYHQQDILNLTTMVYNTPRGSSSKIFIYFKDCTVHHTYYD